MASEFANLVKGMQRRDTEVNVEQALREERGRLSDKAREARRPLPPESLVGALQDTVHEDTGRTRAVHVGTREEPSDA